MSVFSKFWISWGCRSNRPLNHLVGILTNGDEGGANEGPIVQERAGDGRVEREERPIAPVLADVDNGA
jgi:hypothetical protein